MPGNEVGDRIHNFFGQENLSQGQHHSQVVDGTWPGLNNNLWVGGQRQIGAPLISNLKNYSVQQSADSERGHGGPSSTLQHGLNFTQSPLKPEVARSHSQNQQPTLNGYMHGHQTLQTRQSESNFLGVDAEYNRHNLTSRGLPVLDSHLGNGPELNKKNSVRMESTESPVNYDFFGSQQQMSSQNPGMLQSLPRQQPGISEMQLLHQQAVFKKMQEFQRQQQLHNPQFQQQEARQPSSIDQISSVVKQGAASHTSALINGIPIQDASNYSWQPEHVAANTNWLQRSASPVMQGSSSGLMFSPDQGQARVMGLVPQQTDQSLYGVPITSSRSNPNHYIQMEKPTAQHTSANSNSFPGNQYATFLDQGSIQDGTMVSRQGYQGKNTYGPEAGQGFHGGLNLESMQQLNTPQRSAPMQEFHGRQEFVGPSETSQEKTVMESAASQSAATLDPEEEKILFGSDENLWDAFGRGTNLGSGCSNMLDSTDFHGAFPSLQSGSWSALMQSAVAETSTDDVGLQEGWSGLGVRNSEPAAHQASFVNDGSKQPSAWADNNSHTVSTPNPRPFPMSVDANTSANYSSHSGVQQSGLKTSHERREKLPNDSSQRFIQQFSGEGNKWLDRGPLPKPVAEGGQFFGSAAHSSDAELNVKGISPSWTHQESMSSYSTSGQVCNRPNGWNFIESVSPGGGATSKTQGNESSLQLSQSSDHTSTMHEKMGHGSGLRKTNSGSNVTENAIFASGRPQVNREDSNMNNAATISDSNTVRANQKSGQQISNSHNINFWKNVGSSVNIRGSEVPGKSQHHDKSPQNIESSGNKGSDNGGMEHEEENPTVKEKSSDSFRSNMSQHTSTAGLRENVWLDASDTRNLPGGNQKSSGHVSRKPSATRKFQYHPMGDVDIDSESSYGIKNVAHLHSTPQQVSRGLIEQPHFGQSKYINQIAKNSMESEKGHLPGFQGDAKYLDEVPSKSMHPGYVPVTSSPFDKSVGNYAPNKNASSSQNMLELLHKVDQPKEHCPAMHFSSSDRNQSEMPEAETSDGSVGHLQQNQTSSSQGFGLQLAPPSQPLSIPDHALSSQISAHAVSSGSTTCVASEMGRKGHTWLSSSTSVESRHPSYSTSQGDTRSNISSGSGQIGNKASQYNIQGNYSAGFPHVRSHLQNQQMSGVGGQATPTQSVKLSFDRFVSQSKQIDDSCDRTQTSQLAMASVPDMSKGAAHNELTSSAETSQLSSNNQNSARGSAQQFPVLEAMPVSQPSVTPGMSQHGAFSKMLPNMWPNFPNQQHSSVAQTPPNLFKPQPQSTNNVEKSSSGKLKRDDQVAQRVDSGSPGFAGYSVQPQGFSGDEQSAKEQHISPENDAGLKTVGASHLQGKESVVDHLSDTSISNSTTKQRDIEAFGRSLKPNNLLHQKYSLLHQMQAMKGTDVDPENRSVKRFKGSDCSMDAQQEAHVGGQQLPYGSNNMIRDASINHGSLPPGDSKVLNFSPQMGNSHHGAHTPPNDMVAIDRNDSQRVANINNAVTVRGEQSQISLQMAPSWFDQYGAFKNGQMLQMYDARKNATLKTMEQSIIVGKPSDSFHVGHSMPVNTVADASHLSKVQQSSSLMSQPSDHLSSPQSLPPVIADQSLVLVRPQKRKTATFELLPWHREVLLGSQRLRNISMAEMEWAQAANRLMEKVEDETELTEDGPPRSKRRLILTTQLMQQVFHPPPGKLLSSDASSHYESVTYFVARSALGDACSTISSSRTDTSAHPDSGNLLSEKPKTSERIGDQYITKAMEDFIDRAKKLEEDLSRLDKGASILDLRVECQDLEKFSVINRFAKFHGRGQADGAETSSSSDTNTQKFFPQRYVTALPVPRNLPDRVQCLSL
ncbi:uncharacterized protein LOC116116103 [Pistacia vera]|uniref:uncharacterized protein LOC116116103 n=1 Tax=Pistacia vera TaxID=55513 RepID=UPI00126379B9|nr:uncharacterized protein LOC116116103 [Pistacia vera]XP_031258076.1 uncharacterized protein LOC116116103 [Pistacia vera]